MFRMLMMQGTGSLSFSMPSASANYETSMDWNQIVKRTFDPTNNGIKCVDVGAASGDHGTDLDTDEIWQNVYDGTNGAIRVTFVSVGDPPPAVKIRHGYRSILKDCYDPTTHALRMTYSEADDSYGARLDFEQVWEALYVPGLHALRIKNPIAGSGTYGTHLDGKQAIKAAFELATGKLVVVG